MPTYPYSISTAYNTTDRLNSFRHVLRLFSNGASDRYALIVNNSTSKIEMLKSTDAGATWGSALDSANSLVRSSYFGTCLYDAIVDEADPTKIHVAWMTNGSTVNDPTNNYELSGEFKIITFTMGADTWGTASTGGPKAAYSFGASVDGGEVWGAVFFNLAKDYATGTFWLTYCDFLPDLNLGQVWQRPCLASYNGSWSSSVEMMVSSDYRNVRPAGIAIGDSGRVHVLFTVYYLDPGFTYQYHLEVWHQSYLSGVLGTAQLITADGIGFAGNWDNSSGTLVTRNVGGSTELLFGFGYAGVAYPGTGSTYWDSFEPRVGRAMSAQNPSWTLEAISVTTTTQPTGFDSEGNAWAAVLVSGSQLVCYWYNQTGSYPNIYSQIYYSQHDGSSWGAATAAFPNSTLSYYFGSMAWAALVDSGAKLAMLFSGGAAIAPAPGGDTYYEITLPVIPTTGTATFELPAPLIVSGGEGMPGAQALYIGV